ncbi:MAG: hypothetical protein K5666_02450, partial [Bacilli bacterium]|nr:hypothetical protein [Bacilli bacterium]
EIYVKKGINKRMFYIINLKLNDNKEAYKLISRYMHCKVKKADDIIDNFKKINVFLDTYGCVPSPSTISVLIKNDVAFKDMVESLFNQYEDNIKNGELDDLFDIPLIILSIDTYCEDRGIEIKSNDYKSLEKLNINESKYEEIDSVKMCLREYTNKPLLTLKEARELFTILKYGVEGKTEEETEVKQPTIPQQTNAQFDYINLPAFATMLNNLSQPDYTIAALRFGYVNGRCY